MVPPWHRKQVERLIQEILVVAAYCPIVVILLCTASLACAADAVSVPVRPDAVLTRNAEMKRRVDAWLKEGQEVRMPVHVVYLSCEDQEPFPKHKERLNRVLTEVQTWMADQHESAGFGRTTMLLERDDAGMVKLHEAKLPFAVASRNRKLISQTHRACIDASKAVLSKANVNYDKSFVLVLTTIPDDLGAAPFFGNIIQDRGYCFAVDAPWLDSEYRKTDGEVVWKGKRIGPANSALIGGIAHELGHGLGLPHSDEPPSEKQYGESLMGSGNYTWRGELRNEGKGSYLLDTDAMLLIARPPFTARVRDFDKQPKARIDDLKFENIEGGLVKVTGKVVTDIPAHAVKLSDDPPDNSDYNSVAWAVLPDEKTGQFTLTFEPLKAAGEHELRLLLYHVNGRWTKLSNKMTVEKDGTVKLP